MDGGGDLFYRAEDKHDFTKPKKINFHVVGNNHTPLECAALLGSR